MSHSLRLALCSMIAAMGTAIMFLTGLIPFGTYALPAFAGILLFPVVIEIGTKWAVGVFVAESVLSVFLAPDKEALACFILFFGYYPILKAVLEHRLQKRWICMAVKLLVFNTAMLLEFWIAVAVLQTPLEAFFVFGVFIPFLLILAGNILFIIYDYALSLLVVSYCNRIHMSVRKWFHMK